MSSDNMAARISQTRSLLSSLSSALSSFKSSSANFRIVRTLPTQTSPSTISTPSTTPPPLYILDSSFNPPSRAHLSLCTSALRTHSHQTPPRLLLLFSTHNADKAPSPASFEHRLALMTLLATDLLSTLSSSSKPSNPSATIDVGITKAPYYTDKSRAISESGDYQAHTPHVHLIGYDTLTRFLAPKYYTSHSPPLSALAPYFDAGHGVLCTMRAESSSENAVSEDSVEAQQGFLAGLKEGKLEAEGFRREWAGSIELIKAGEEAVGVSSTAVRKAAKEGNWAEVERMCTGSVSAWIREEGLYRDDSRGSKMA